MTTDYPDESNNSWPQCAEARIPRAALLVLIASHCLLIKVIRAPPCALGNRGGMHHLICRAKPFEIFHINELVHLALVSKFCNRPHIAPALGPARAKNYVHVVGLSVRMQRPLSLAIHVVIKVA